jgi:hypothetical protein
MKRVWRDGAALVRAELEAEGGLIAAALHPEADGHGEGAPGPAQVAAAGPRAAGRERDIELAVAAVHEGYLLHYACGRVVATDGDMALLAGDRLYALGLARLAALGALDAVAELADVIALSAQAHAAGDEDLAEAVWEAGSAAIGWGGSRELDHAKEAARAGAPGAAPALRAAARHLRDTRHGGTAHHRVPAR